MVNNAAIIVWYCFNTLAPGGADELSDVDDDQLPRDVESNGGDGQDDRHAVRDVPVVRPR
jgi:hypothetical protein